MQDVKIRAEAIRRERGASQKAAAEVRKAASADKAKAANAANSANASKATCVDKAAVGAGDDGAAKPTTTTTRRKRQQQPVWKLALEKEKEQKRVARKRDEELKTVAMQDVAQKRALRKRNKDLRAGKVSSSLPHSAAAALGGVIWIGFSSSLLFPPSLLFMNVWPVRLPF